MKAIRVWLSIGAIGLTGVLVGGCGGDDSDTTVTETSGQETTPTGTTGADTGESAACVDVWNRRSNSSGQETLVGLYPDGASGKVVVGVEDGACVLSSYTEGDSEYVVFTQAGDGFEETGGGPVEEFGQYESSIAPLDVVLQASGEVKPVSK